MHGEKEKRQINTTLVRSRATQRPSVTDLCWLIVYRTSDGRPEASQMESSSRPCAQQASPIRHNRKLAITSTRHRGPLPPFFAVWPRRRKCPGDLPSELFPQPGSIHTIQYAPTHILRPQSVQVSSSSLSQQVTVIEVLPHVLVLHVKHFVATGGVDKMGKPVRFFLRSSKIPPGTTSFPLSSRGIQGWHPLLDNSSCRHDTRSVQPGLVRILRKWWALIVDWQPSPSTATVCVRVEHADRIIREYSMA